MPWPTLVDDEIDRLTAAEIDRQNTAIQLIASENFASPAVMGATGSVFTNKYAEGYPGRRYYGGNQVVDEVEELARTRICDLFGADHRKIGMAGTQVPPAAQLRDTPLGDAKSAVIEGRVVNVGAVWAQSEAPAAR